MARPSNGSASTGADSTETKATNAPPFTFFESAMASSEDVKQLIEGCKAQRPSAQRELYSRFSGQLFATAIRHTNAREDAEDVLQDSFVKIFKHIKSYRQDFSFEGWMRRIVVNTAITHYRRNLKHRHHHDIDEVHSTPRDLESHPDLEFTADELEHAIAQLPLGYRTVFCMYVIEGFKHQEIADKLGVDVNTSKSQLSRARKYLQRVLATLSARAQSNPSEPQDEGAHRP
jgi:RNA polymerase sigma-70 factor (ECF subfamily)